MANITDVVIIGSGALGCATAYAIAASGARRVMVVDRGPLVSGMTRRSAGLVHTHASHPALVRLIQSSLDTYRRWAGVVGGSCGFSETGTLVIATTAQQAGTLRDRFRTQESLGIDVRLLDFGAIASVSPHISSSDMTLAAYEPVSGYVDAVLVAQGFARVARERGARFETGTMVRRIRLEHSRVVEVVTTTGSIKTTSVIIAAGSGAERLLAPLGFSLSLRFSQSAIGFFDQPEELQDGHPAIVDPTSGDFIRPHSFHLSAAGVTSTDTGGHLVEALEEAPSSSEREAMKRFVARRLPLLENAPLRRSHTILYDGVADGLPVIGAIPGFEGLYVAAGLGDQAVAAAPGVGRALGEIVVDGASAIDLAEFRPSRPFLTHSVTQAGGHAD